MTSTLIATEDDLQVQVASFLNVALPDGCIFHHSPNEGKRHVSYINRLKRFCPQNTTSSGHNEAIFIELKIKRGRLTANQETMRDLLRNAGFSWGLCKSVEDVYLFLKPLVHLRAIM